MRWICSLLFHARWQRSTQAFPLKVRSRVRAGTRIWGLSFSPIAQPSFTCSKMGGGPSIIVIFSSIIYLYLFRMGRHHTIKSGSHPDRTPGSRQYLQISNNLPNQPRPTVDEARIKLD